MRRLLSCLMSGLFLITLYAGVSRAAATAPEQASSSPAIEQILDSRCGGCHTRGRIDAARERGDDFLPIAQRMESRGVILTKEERAAIMTFWGPALKNSAPPAPAKNISDEAEAVIQSRCLQCHTRERIDQAIAARLPFATMEAIMLKRGVVLGGRESQILKIFWGSPLSQ